MHCGNVKTVRERHSTESEVTARKVTLLTKVTVVVVRFNFGFLSEILKTNKMLCY